MIKLSHTLLVILSGALWLAVGLMLLPKGLGLLTATLAPAVGGVQNHYPLLSWLGPLCGGADRAVVVLIAVGLAVGFLKGRFVLRKTVVRVVDRIRSYANPAPLSSAYSMGYCLLIAGMILLGVLMNVANVSSDLRGFIDIAIGAALINGSILYFRAAATHR